MKYERVKVLVLCSIYITRLILPYLMNHVLYRLLFILHNSISRYSLLDEYKMINFSGRITIIFINKIILELCSLPKKI